MLRPVTAFLLCVLLSSAALAQKRVALVIGNSAYQHTPTLANPRNDATDMVAALKKLGFQVVEGFDLDKPAFDRKVRDFADALSGARVGVFFYAGHGLQVAGANYLVPIDARLSTASALDWEMVRLDLVQRTMERETETNVIFLDACRDNPLARNLARAMGTRSTEVGRGLAATEAGVGTLISFSTQPGNVALDGAGRNSPFAGALVRRVATPGDDLSALLIDVRNDVRKETQNKQVPWEHSALTGRFYFNPSAQTASPPGVASARLSEAAEAWGIVKDATSLPPLEAYISRYKDTFYAELARQRIEELKKQRVAVAAPPKAPPPPKTAKPVVAVAPTPSAGCDGVEAQVGNERRCLKPGTGQTDWFMDCPTCPEMVAIPTGRFTMGSPQDETSPKSEDQVSVTIAKPFAVGRFAVTRGEFAAFVTATGHKTDGGCPVYAEVVGISSVGVVSRHVRDRNVPGGELEQQPDRDWRTPGFSQSDRHPAACVNWKDAKAYVTWLSTHTGRTYRLLSEAEREYVTRASTTTPFWWGSTVSTGQANYNAGGYDWRKETVAVDSFAANPWGLYNVHGNVWEWTEDCWNDKNAGNPGNGSARTSGDCGSRVLRGGSWNSIPSALRSANRVGVPPSYRSGSYGFRVARTLD
jgi:formylglycine-generating enzyme required for sulfatase activity